MLQPPTEQWGAALRDARRAKGCSQKALGDQIGVDQSVISDWERGEYSPSDPNKLRLADALDVPVGALFPWHEEAAS